MQKDTFRNPVPFNDGFGEALVFVRTEMDVIVFCCDF